MQLQPNTIGTAQVTAVLLPLIRKGQKKQIIYMSSAAASIPLALNTDFGIQPGYSTSKAALNMVAAKYAVALKEEGVIILTIHPGLVKTLPGCA